MVCTKTNQPHGFGRLNCTTNYPLLVWYSRMDFLIDSGDWFKKKVNMLYKNILMENRQKINEKIDFY